MIKKIAILMGEFRKNKTEITQALITNNIEVIYTERPDQLLACLENQSHAAVILESVNTNEWEAITVSQRINAVHRSIPVFLLVENSCERLAIDAIKAGVYDYFTLPVDLPDFIHSINRIFQADFFTEHTPSETCCPQRDSQPPQSEIVGSSAQINHVRHLSEKAAKTNSTVLITGETGTGKELVARLIHHASSRRNLPNVCVNCAAIPESLLESELFGYERGAFTGAANNRDGILMSANKGTLFLDEIGEMSGFAQAKILRAIETKIVQRVGSKHAIPVDIRVIAATNQKLEELVEISQFRRDLFFRLNVARIHLPALRERLNDIPPLCEHFIARFNDQFKQCVTNVDSEVLQLFHQYSWPGNVRELKNVMEAVFINQPLNEIHVKDLPEYYLDVLTNHSRDQKQAGMHAAVPVHTHTTNNPPSHAEERDKLLVALLSTNWNKSKAAQKMKWSRMTLYRKMQKYNLKEVEVEK